MSSLGCEKIFEILFGFPRFFPGSPPPPLPSGGHCIKGAATYNIMHTLLVYIVCLLRTIRDELLSPLSSPQTGGAIKKLKKAQLHPSFKAFKDKNILLYTHIFEKSSFYEQNSRRTNLHTLSGFH